MNLKKAGRMLGHQEDWRLYSKQIQEERGLQTTRSGIKRKKNEYTSLKKAGRILQYQEDWGLYLEKTQEEKGLKTMRSRIKKKKIKY